ncbi:efflux RND transporter periplasmic adaptor subunit [Pendulispora rubella]|uniref:Efflux RND transporter periplasmic adaptor subunit n=1 Tax=Pendulispora rubella TaxID=2741070 RepID=A0ABZ2LCB5_9BACT
MRSKWTVLIASATYVVALATNGCGKSAASEKTQTTAATTPQGPRTVKLELESLKRLGVRVEALGANAPSRTLRVPGTLDYNFDHYAEIGVPLEGRVATVNVRAGDAVKKGKVLGTVVIPSIASAQAEFLSAQANATAAAKNRQREAELLQRQLTTARESEVARSEADQAQAHLAAAEARLRALRVGVPQNENVVAGAGTLSLSSPIDGVVVARKVNLGAFIQPADKAFIVADLRELWATLDVHESDVSYLKIGAEVELSIDAHPGQGFKGKITLLDPQVGGVTRSVRARVSVPNADGQLKPGLFLRAQIQIPADEAGRMMIAGGAVQPLGEEDVVFVEREPGTFEIRPVKVGRRTVDLVEILEGVTSGERVAVDGAFLLRGEASKQ